MTDEEIKKIFKKDLQRFRRADGRPGYVYGLSEYDLVYFAREIESTVLKESKNSN